MTKKEALELIDAHKNKLIHPVELLHWTWLRVVVLHLTEEAWEEAMLLAVETMSK